MLIKLNILFTALLGLIFPFRFSCCCATCRRPTFARIATIVLKKEKLAHRYIYVLHKALFTNGIHTYKRTTVLNLHSMPGSD